MIGVLGDIVFEATADRVRTWNELSGSSPARWAVHEVFGAKPKQEFLGPGLGTFSMSVRLDIERGVVPRDELAKMELAKKTGAVQAFSIGGRPVGDGDWIIKDVHVEYRRWNSSGVLLFANATISLEEYQ